MSSKLSSRSIPAPSGSRWSGQNALDQCHLRFGGGEGAKREGQKGGTEGTKVIFSVLWHILGVSGHGAGTPIPGKSHKHMKEHEHGEECETAFLPFLTVTLSLQLRKLKLRTSSRLCS